MKTRVVISVSWYVFVVLTMAGCTAEAPIPTEVPTQPSLNSYSPGSIGDYVITEITINEPNRFISFTTKHTLVELEDNRYRITEEIADGNPPEGYQVTPELWINFSDITTAYGDRNIGETWTDNMMGQEVSVRRLENETVQIGDSSFEAIVVEITPIDQTMRWKLIQHLSYEVPITPFIRTLRITWEIGASGGQIISNFESSIIEIGRASN